jgi:hypothetical protein
MNFRYLKLYDLYQVSQLMSDLGPKKQFIDWSNVHALLVGIRRVSAVFSQPVQISFIVYSSTVCSAMSILGHCDKKLVVIFVRCVFATPSWASSFDLT